MAGAVKRNTKGFGFNILSFDFPQWHRYEHDNWDLLDAILRAYVSNFLKGLWKNSTTYQIGDRVIDDDTSEVYIALVLHTSAATGSFSADRALNPTYWQTSTYDPKNRGLWEAGQVYSRNDFVSYGYKYVVVDQNHLSVNFDSDLAAGKLTVLIDMGPAIEAAISFDPGNFVPITRSVNGHQLNGNIVLDKDDVGLGAVDNTADLSKPVSTAVQDALNFKANSNNPTFTGTVTGVTKTMVGLGSVDNTADINKPVSSPQATALLGKFDKTGGSVSGNITITAAGNHAIYAQSTSGGGGIHAIGSFSFNGVSGIAGGNTTSGVSGLSSDGNVFGLLGYANAYSFYGNNTIHTAGNITASMNITATGNMSGADITAQTNIGSLGGGQVNGNFTVIGDIFTISGYNTTTGSAANVNILSSGRLQRSTSSLAYKKDVEPLEADYGNKILELKPIYYRSNELTNDDPNLSWFGYGAEDVAKIDPRFANWAQVPKKNKKGELEFEGKGTKKTLVLTEEKVPDGINLSAIVAAMNEYIIRLEERIKVLEAGKNDG